LAALFGKEAVRQQAEVVADGQHPFGSGPTVFGAERVARKRRIHRLEHRQSECHAGTAEDLATMQRGTAQRGCVVIGFHGSHLLFFEGSWHLLRNMSLRATSWINVRTP